MSETTRTEQPYPRLQAAFAALADWIRRAEDRHDLSTLPSGELDTIAHDLGISVHELCAVTAKGEEASPLLCARMAAIDLDRPAIERTFPAVMQDLKRVCSLCSEHRRCVRDLRRDTRDPVWKSYCPNVQTLDALKAQA